MSARASEASRGEQCDGGGLGRDEFIFAKDG